MKDLNKVQLTGHVGADPEVRHADNGTVVTKFTVASNRRWTDQQGAAQEETEWFNLVTFNRLAEIAGDYLAKGAHVYCEGRLHTRQFDDPDTGQKRYWTEVVVNEFLDAFSAADLERMRALLAEDLVAYVTNASGGEDRVEGRDGYLARLEAMDLPSARFSVVPTQPPVLVDPDRILVMVEVHAERPGRSLENYAAQQIQPEA